MVQFTSKKGMSDDAYYVSVNLRLTFTDRSLFIALGEGEEDFRGDHLIFWGKKGGISRN